MRRVRILGFMIGLLMSMNGWAELPTAKQIASKLEIGWNLGNSLEVTWWTPDTTTQAGYPGYHRRVWCVQTKT